MPNSRRKGKRGELEAAAEIRRLLGLPARRGQQYRGTADSPDVIVDLPGVHFEVKRTERLRIYQAVEQARRDAHPKIPVVLFRSNRREWLAIVPLEDLVALAERLVMFGEG